MPSFVTAVTFPENNKCPQTSRALQARRAHAAQSICHGAPHPQPRGGGPGVRSISSRVLRPARFRGAIDHRGEPGLATGPGIPRHPRHLQQGTGRRLAQGRRSRPSTQRTHLPSALARRPHFHIPRCSPNNGAPGAPSAIRAADKTFVDNAFTDISEPRALTLEEVPEIIDSFKRGAANAIEAGFDGVEVHGANGYLLDQFAKDGTNKRTDAYGGSIANRSRLMLEVAKAVASEVGAARTGVRLSPVAPLNDITESNPQALYDFIVDQLNALKLAYIHVVEGATGGPRDVAPFDYESLRKRFNGAYIANNGYDFELANKVLAANAADLIAFGKPYIANPDLVERLKRAAPLNTPDTATFYGGDAKGYTDYPVLDAAQ
jgi:N-ethylmaleimide reductase